MAETPTAPVLQKKSRVKKSALNENRKNAIKHAQEARILMRICASGAVFQGATFYGGPSRIRGTKKKTRFLKPSP